jgi:hypothetical protein
MRSQWNHEHGIAQTDLPTHKKTQLQRQKVTR